MSQEPCSSFDNRALLAEWSKVKKPGLPAESLKRLGDAFPLSFSWGDFSVGIPQITQAISPNHRYYVAAYRWLQPNEPLMTSSDLNRCRSEFGLDSLPLATFAEEVAARCSLIQQTHPVLKNWIEKRVALLAFHFDRPVFDYAEGHRVAKKLRELSDAAMALYFQGHYVEAATVASDGVSDSLLAAGSTVNAVLSKHNCTLQASIMMPYSGDPNSIPLLEPLELVSHNRQKASQIWSHLQVPATNLVIVGETKPPQHIGFWVPVISADQTKSLPGAPWAFQRMEGSAVFRDDPPPLTGFDTKLEGEWLRYIRNDLVEPVFLSLPYFHTDDRTGIDKVVAVLNIDAIPASVDWKRSFHREWTDKAVQAAAPFVEVAIKCAKIRYMSLIKQRTQKLDSLTGWTNLIGEQFTGLLEANDE